MLSELSPGRQGESRREGLQVLSFTFLHLLQLRVFFLPKFPPRQAPAQGRLLLPRADNKKGRRRRVRRPLQGCDSQSSTLPAIGIDSVSRHNLPSVHRATAEPGHRNAAIPRSQKAVNLQTLMPVSGQGRNLSNHPSFLELQGYAEMNLKTLFGDEIAGKRRQIAFRPDQGSGGAVERKEEGVMKKRTAARVHTREPTRRNPSGSPADLSGLTRPVLRLEQLVRPMGRRERRLETRPEGEADMKCTEGWRKQSFRPGAYSQTQGLQSDPRATARSRAYSQTQGLQPDPRPTARPRAYSQIRDLQPDPGPTVRPRAYSQIRDLQPDPGPTVRSETYSQTRGLQPEPGPTVRSETYSQTQGLQSDPRPTARPRAYSEIRDLQPDPGPTVRSETYSQIRDLQPDPGPTVRSETYSQTQGLQSDPRPTARPRAYSQIRDLQPDPRPTVRSETYSQIRDLQPDPGPTARPKAYSQIRELQLDPGPTARPRAYSQIRDLQLDPGPTARPRAYSQTRLVQHTSQSIGSPGTPPSTPLSSPTPPSPSTVSTRTTLPPSHSSLSEQISLHVITWEGQDSAEESRRQAHCQPAMFEEGNISQMESRQADQAPRNYGKN
ncbi:hypothetical protein P4O66_013243 [Electrophorus voltai]|uniref:Uncharacterized protein n=1 Tax=Electrophorus voltai TaxID=2609070 RepID=A0AAD9DSL8_9TELE|nr:hypothetical protein P4O66_013243 [Electrophorus voltai]